jgi:ABC-2 type transport system permease protein
MNWHRIRTVFGKEWLELRTNRSLLATLIIPLVMFLIIPLVTAFVLPIFLGAALTADPDIEDVVGLLMETFPNFANLTAIEQFQVYMLRQFLALFLLSPIIGSMSIATYSIIGEKTTRSLEALLASPIRTDELLLAKSLAAAIPPIVVTWLMFLLFAAIILVLGGWNVFIYTMDSAAWGMMLLIAPLVALLGLGIGVIVSSRANDPRTAQQVGGLVVLPIVALVVGQSAGIFLLGLPLVLIAAVVLFLIDLALLGIGVSLFNRESILTKWK